MMMRDFFFVTVPTIELGIKLGRHYMSFKKTLAAGAVLTMSLVSATSLPSMAATSIVKDWGTWGFDHPSDLTAGSIDFASGLTDATWTLSADDDYEVDVLSVASTGEYFDATTPIGSAFGSNGPTGNDNFLKFTTDPFEGTDGFVTITFAEPIAAGDLAIAVSDIDSDETEISATTDGTTALTTQELKGNAGEGFSDLSFNFCANRNTEPCSTDTAVVPVSDQTSHIQFGDRQDGDLWGTDGVSAWVNPTVAVKTVTVRIINGDSNPSSERVWIAQKGSVESLANTGSNSDANVEIAAGLVLAGLAIRSLSTFRRRGEARHRA